MSHVVMQAAEFSTVAAAEQAAAELRRLVADYVTYEGTADAPWSEGAVPAPLVEFGRRHGVPWPGDPTSRFLLKGLFNDEASVLSVDRLVFFWGGGFDLGGAWLREVLLRGLGAVYCTDAPRLAVRVDDPQARAAASAEFLVEEDHEEQFTTTSDDAVLDRALFTITFEPDGDRVHLTFEDSGGQDWAFVAMLPQLSGDDPTLRAPARGLHASVVDGGGALG
ncbi:hypothetical protein [Sorangium cellulosum]|uniref:Uncharacterized protein n=1 Tax=Sorangium cellulosum TaxID=56 RepID=A0A150QYQ1_SORCE|nr:hypothetical protein [Sorangium cellulosum]KYF72991.1 hypothetical protein BE15_04715 [Sorangium cellulosum]